MIICYVTEKITQTPVLIYAAVQLKRNDKLARA